MYKIVICDDDGKTTIIPFSRREFHIGRNEGNAVRLTDRNISRRHAILSKEADSFYIEDLGSRNGIRMNNEPIGKGITEVQLEDRIMIGDYRISVSDKEYSSIPWGKQVDPLVDKTVGKVTSFARLVMVEGPQCGLELALEEELYIVGRGDRSNMYIDDPSISRAHARLEGSEDHWIVSDLDSSNGLYINGYKRDDYRLRAGDVVEFGNVHFRYVAPGEPYDYEYASLEQVRKDHNTRSRAIGMTGIAVILLLLFATWIALKLIKENNGDDSDVTQRLEKYNKVLAQGDALMMAQHWEDAAKLFAEAQGMGFGATKAKERKKQAMLELEAKDSLEAARGAMNEEDWALAVNELSKVPENSVYFDKKLASKAADKLCEELIYKVEFMVTSGDKDVATVLSAIGDIPYASPTCLRKREAIQKSLP